MGSGHRQDTSGDVFAPFGAVSRPSRSLSCRSCEVRFSSSFSERLKAEIKGCHFFAMLTHRCIAGTPIKEYTVRLARGSHSANSARARSAFFPPQPQRTL
eukprot:1941911-Rhodomonas_salina.1